MAGLGGAGTLLVLCKVALYGLITGGEIPVGIGVGETRPSGEVAGFDSGNPGGFDWESSRGVEVADKGTYAGEIVGVEGSRGCRSSRMDLGDRVVFGLEREEPKLDAGGVSPSFN